MAKKKEPSSRSYRGGAVIYCGPTTWCVGLPPFETKMPGVQCRTRKHGIYLVTENELRNKFTLWKESADGYEKIATANNPTKLYDKIPW